MQSPLLLLLLLLQVFCSFALLFNTNLQEECINGCLFSNASLWVGGQAPLPSDEVIITFNSSSLSPSVSLSSLFIIINEDTQVNGISLITSNLIIINSSLSLISMSVDEDSTLTTFNTSTISMQGFLLLNGNVTLNDKSLITSSATSPQIFVQGVLTLNDQAYVNMYTGEFGIFPSGTVTAGEDTTIIASTLFAFGSFVSFSVIGAGTLNVSSSSTILLYGGFVGDFITVRNSSLHINNRLSAQIYLSGGSEMIVSNVTGTIQNIAYSDSPVISGSGILSLQDSNITFSSIKMIPIPNTIAIFGQTIINAINVEFLSLEMGMNANIAFNGNNVVVAGSVYLTDVVAYGNGINVTGQLTIVPSGSLSVENSILINQGAIIARSNITLNVVNSTIMLAGNFTGVHMELDSNSSLSVSSPSFIFSGGIINHGTLSVQNSNTLDLTDGDFTQYDDGNMVAELNYKKASSPSLIASIISLSGKLHYSVDSKPLKSYSFLIASATNSLISNITSSQSVEHSELNKPLNIEVRNNKSLYLNYKLNAKDLPTWVYFVSGAGALLLILLIIAFIVKMSRRNSYQSL